MARITFEVSAEQHSHIKMMAASKGLSIKDYFLDMVKTALPSAGTLQPSRATKKVLEDTDAYRNLNFRTNLDDSYYDLGLTKYLPQDGNKFIPGLIKNIMNSEKAA